MGITLDQRRDYQYPGIFVAFNGSFVSDNVIAGAVRFWFFGRLYFSMEEITMAIKLYSWPRSSGTRVSWTLEELGVPYEYVTLDPQKGEHRTPQYLALHPLGKIPALIDGDQTFFESYAMLLHLGEKYGVAKGLWPSGDGQPRADALSWTVWALSEMSLHMMQYMYHGLDTPMSYDAADRSKAAAEYSRSQFVACLDALEKRLDGRDHLLGNFSLVDIACSSLLMFGTMFGIKLDAHPRVEAWFKRCSQRPALARAR
jgi:glutathione S-transferase